MTRNGVTTAAVEKERGRVARIVLLHDKRFRIVATRSLLSPSLSLYGGSWKEREKAKEKGRRREMRIERKGRKAKKGGEIGRRR